MIVTCETTRIIHSNDNFQLVGCIPIGEYDNLVVHPTYHNFTVKDPSHRLIEHKRYTLDISELPPTKYGVSYVLNDIPSLSFQDPSDITDDMELELLYEIMSKTQAKNVHKAYPNFIRLVLENRMDEIDIGKVHNVADKRLRSYINKIYTKYNSFLLRARVKHYDLTELECSAIFSIYDSINECINALNKNPYYCLVSICGRSFRRADVAILSHDKGLKRSQERIEYMLDYAISQFENDGSTYVDAYRLGEYVYTLDADVVDMLKDVAMQSDIIHYDEDLNILQRQSTYEAELNIAKFFKEKSETQHVLEWDWDKYTEIKDGTLTEEQQQVLKLFCEHNVILLDAPSGTGKSSTMMALIQMIEDNGLTYIMMSPTGKAASRLAEQTGRSASTIHRAVFSNALFDKDVVIIDEASMLSVPLCKMIVDSELLDGARFVLIGDSAQIPSIGLGKIFKDLGGSNIIPKCTLTKCFRFDEGGASYISTLTRQGQFYMTNDQEHSDTFTIGKRKDYEFIKFNGDVNQIVDTYMNLIDNGAKPEEVIVLVPYNIGHYGATTINNLIQARLNPVGNDLSLNTKHNDINVAIHKNDLVMNIKNNYNAMSYQAYNDALWDDDSNVDDYGSAQVFNGQIGKVRDVINDTEVLHSKFLVAHIEGEDIMYTTGEANNLLLAYCSNPYKFQGSQCKYVINVVIGAHERAWNRQLLYTSQTRMTDKLIEIGDIDVIKQAVKTAGDDNRATRLMEFLTNDKA